MVDGAKGHAVSTPALVAAAHDVAEVVEAHADEAERMRRLPAATVDALVAADLMRMCLPAAYGGPEVDPMTMAEAIEAVSHADGAAGWCSMIASTTASMAAYLPIEGAKQIYGDPLVVTGGVFAPNGRGRARRVDGVDGFEVTGRWSWGSGSQHCHWVLGGTRCDDDTFRLCWFSQDDLTFHDTWYSSGMRGSGSLDYSVDGAFSPADHTMQPFVGTPVIDSALSRFPSFTLLATGVCAVGLGVGRRALDEVIEIAQGKKPQFSSRTLAQSGFTQVEVARAEARLRSARAFLLDELAGAWEAASQGDAVSIEARTDIRLAVVNAAEAAAEVADTAFTLAGGTAVYDTSLLGRCLRDAHVVTQHIQTAPKLYETLGKLHLAQEADTSML